MVGKLMRNFQKHPDVAQASRVGQPTLVDPQMVSAKDVVDQAAKAMTRSSSGAADSNKVSIEALGVGAPPPNQAAPRSDAPPTSPETKDNSATAAQTSPPTNETAPNPAADSQRESSLLSIVPAIGAVASCDTPVTSMMIPISKAS